MAEAKYRYLQTSFWTDVDIIDEFTPEDRYFYTYLLTNPHTSQCGIYEISYKHMETETGYNKDTINNMINRFETVHKKIKYNPDTKEIAIKNWPRYNYTNSPTVQKCIINELEKVKDRSLIQFLEYPINTLSIPYFPERPQKEKEKEKEKENNKYIVDLLEYWNSLEIRIHQPEVAIRYVEKRHRENIEFWGTEKIREAMKNYSEVLERSDFFHYRWSFWDFIGRKNAIPNFVSEADPIGNFCDKDRSKVLKYLKEKGMAK